MTKKITNILTLIFLIFLLIACNEDQKFEDYNELKSGFIQPPDSARPGVYWYFMDGNLSKVGMTKDLESMKKAGIGQVVFLEVNVGVPRGEVDFMSEEWLDHFEHMVRETERLGITITLGVGPGWTGSGGPWVKGNESMRHLVASKTTVKGGIEVQIELAVPEPKDPYFGLHQFPEPIRERWEEYYEDVAVLAFPALKDPFVIDNIEKKALYYREPYTSKPGVKPFIPTKAEYKELSEASVLKNDKILDITEYMDESGMLKWNVPEGDWMILRMGSRNNGAITRPAPLPGVGFEADKFDTSAINAHLSNFTEKLFERVGEPDSSKQGGLKMLHMDSWEMGAQNWTDRFTEEFKERRGYDPLPYFPVYAGFVVGNLEESERFLWDLRQTSMELIIENHAEHLKSYGKNYHMGFSIEPYDMNPTADMELGGVADVPMCEFWTKDYGFISSWSCIQAASIAHINDNPVVAAESFTAHLDEWRVYPGSMKNQGDWAFAAGVNRFVYHTFQHQPLDDDLKPGMTMGPFGVHHDRNQTWWPMADGYHDYITRCQYMLQQGKPVADILYLTPEGAPQVFRAPASALTSDNKNQKSLKLGDSDDILSSVTNEEVMPDRKGYNFSGCSPSQLYKANVRDGKIIFPGGAEFQILVLPGIKTMTPGLLNKIEELTEAGAVIIGNPPLRAPGLTNYPECDQNVLEKVNAMWGGIEVSESVTWRSFGEGQIISGKDIYPMDPYELYPDYHFTTDILKELGVKEDFKASPEIRYTHKILDDLEFYFVSNKTENTVEVSCKFDVNGKLPELWDPVKAEFRKLTSFEFDEDQISIPLKFHPWQSYFIVFSEPANEKNDEQSESDNFEEPGEFMTINGPWQVSFDPEWGGPEKVTFNALTDWTENENTGIKYYSGIAVYHNNIQINENDISTEENKYMLHTGRVHNMARVFVNEQDMGVIWTAPWEVDITRALSTGDNKIEIHVVNLWPNRLIGDERMFKYDGIRNNQWPEWLVKGEGRPSGRFTFTTFRHFSEDDELLPSGLTETVKIITYKK